MGESSSPNRDEHSKNIWVATTFSKQPSHPSSSPLNLATTILPVVTAQKTRVGPLRIPWNTGCFLKRDPYNSLWNNPLYTLTILSLYMGDTILYYQ